MDTKTCPRCNINKPKSEYYKDSSKSDKLFYCCKACDKMANSKWQKENKLYLKEIYAIRSKGAKMIVY